jgi:hypothetical protein
MPGLLPTPVRKTNIPENEDNIDVCISDFANGPLETPWRKTPEWNIKASILYTYGKNLIHSYIDVFIRL